MGALTRPAAPSSARIAAVCGLALAAAVAGLLLLGRSAPAHVAAPGGSVEVAASYDPSVAQFGDRIRARVVVAFDTRRVRPQTLRIDDDVAPLTQLGAAQTSRTTQGNVELVTVVVPLSCLTTRCVAPSGVARVRLPAVHASVRTRDGRLARASAAWPTLSVRGRVNAADLAARALEADTTPPALTYRIAPATLATLLDIVAVLCALGAVALAGWEARRRLERRRRPPTALERALRLTREAQRRPAPDRRRALALLGRALDRDERSSAVQELAWSEPSPEPTELEELVSDLERGGEE